jgi:autotransporter-associated beta strand protein
MYLGGLSGASTTQLTCGNKTAGGSITWVVGGAGTDETFNGVINNDAYSSGTGITTIVKEGSGIWRLTGANTYSGTTTVNNGTLVVNGTHSGAGKITVIEGTLAGRGTLKGDVEIQTGAVIQPGDNYINTFTLQGKLNLSSGSVTEVEVNKTTATWDKLTVTGVVTFGGTLKVNFTGTPVVGAVYKIFNQTASPIGNFSAIQPASPGEGMLWSFTPSTGELKIIEGSLPVKLGLFTAKEDGSGVKLAWTTVSEENNDRFEIERSNGSFFTSILTVNGKGTTKSANNYSVYDFNPVKGSNYYRLMQYDLNGKGTDYGIREVKLGLGDASFQIYPNPVTDEFSVKASADSPSWLNAELRTLDGKIIAALAPAVKSGNEFKYRVVQKIASGVYILCLSNDNYKVTKKILIN